MTDLVTLIEQRDVAAIKRYMQENNLKLEGNRIVPATPETKSEILELSSFWNQRQQAR